MAFSDLVFKVDLGPSFDRYGPEVVSVIPTLSVGDACPYIPSCFNSDRTSVLPTSRRRTANPHVKLESSVQTFIDVMPAIIRMLIFEYAMYQPRFTD